MSPRLSQASYRLVFCFAAVCVASWPFTADALAQAAAPKSEANAPQVNAYLVLGLAPLLALAGVVAQQFLPEYFSRRRVVREQYDAAIVAVAQLQAARFTSNLTISPGTLVLAKPENEKLILEELSKEAVRAFIAAASSSRAALAILHPYSPDLRQYWDKFEVSEEELDPLLNTLRKRRAKPLKRYE